MSRPIAASDLQVSRTLAALANLATDLAGERMRRDEAARVLVLARRFAAMTASGAIAAPEATDPASRAVAEIARHWDCALMTAAEYAEMLPPVVLDRLLRAAPSWAAKMSAPTLRRAA